MSANRRIAEGKLAAFWRVSPHTLIRWRNEGRLVSDIKEDAENGFHHYYYTTTVEAYHRAHGTGFGPDRPMPGFSQLLRSEPSLLLAEEAAGRLGCSVVSLLRSIRHGETPAFYLGEQRSVRLPATLISLQASVNEGAVNAATAARILCVSPITVGNLMRSGRLQWTKRVGKGQEKFVDYASLLALLTELIPPYIPPEVWWEKTLQTPGEPLTKEQLVARHHVHKRTVNNLIADQNRSLPYIRTTGGHTVIPAWGVQTFLQEEREQLTPQELAAILGVTAEQAKQWQQAHTLCKRPHGQAWHRCPTRNCMRQYIATHSTHAGLDPDEWLTTTLQLGVAAISSDELIAATPLLRHEDVLHAHEQGLFSIGIWLPPHQGRHRIALPRAAATSFRRRWERSLR